jgi:two-component system LytT family sensor kinase
MEINLTREQILLINLLIRIAVMAGITSLILSFRFIVDSLMKVSVPRTEQAKMAVLVAGIFIAGVIVRKITPQGGAMDLSLEGTLLAGFLGGVWVGTGVGAAIGGVCFLFGETAALPLYAAAGFVSGILFSTLHVRGEPWSYSLNPFLIMYNFFERLFRKQFDLTFIPLAACLVFAVIRYLLLRRLTIDKLYGFMPQETYLLILDLAVLVYTLGVALKMATNARTELMMREEERQLAHARLATLRSQINPHFLFNTLNSISALIRTDTEKARDMTKKLAAIFRKSLEESADTHAFSEELRFIDDYLSIERMRFGDDSFRIVKDIDPETLDTEVPSMILQPIVENAVKHGISQRTEGGVLRIASRRDSDGVEIVVENEGPVNAHFDLDEMVSRGIGLRNVIERLEIYTCAAGRLTIEPREEGGAVVRIRIPHMGERRRSGEDQGVDCR